MSAGALASCVRSSSPRSDILVWGGEGLRDGQFLRPRAAGVHANEVYIIDTTGRVQVFSTDGAFSRMWSMPSAENGTPTGVTFDGEGNIVIPDTHYSQIREYMPTGELTETWGRYGTAPGEFVYPTDLAFGSEGTRFVSEYGDDAERIQVFDAARNPVREWGTLGVAPGELNRAMAIERDSRGLLYVADTGNHRVQVFQEDGEVVRLLGAAGDPELELKFPYDLTIANDNSVLVADYGLHAIVRYDADGGLIGRFGGPGRAPGEFNGPRGVAVSPEGWVFVTDTDNHRIQRFPVEAVA